MKILFAITGSIAAVRSYELIRLLQAQGHSVQCIVTKGGEQFISQLSLEALSENEILGPDVFSFSGGENRDVFSHINISKNTDIILIAPASANTIAKIAHGFADDFLQNLLLANKEKHVLLAPAMNKNMWQNEATQANILLLKERKYTIIPPQKTGTLACGIEGEGKMATIETILSCVKKSKNPQKYTGKKVLISLGGTQEYLDPVRYISNASSGKTGLAIANAFWEMGAEIKIVAGNNSVVLNPDIFSISSVVSTKEMLKKMEENAPWADIVIFSAAVADYTPSHFSSQKLEKQKTEKEIILHFEKTPDIAKTLFTKKRKNQIFIGFCLTSENLKTKMAEKAESKGFDIIFGNNEQNLGSEFGKYLVYSKENNYDEIYGKKDEVFAIFLQEFLLPI